MHNPVRLVLEHVEKSLPIVKKYTDHTEATRLLSEIKQFAEMHSLQIMLYGAYNAGKSSLINALTGQESAPTGDIPTTDRVDAYDWNGFILLDTPGVNAPIEHQDTTEEQIRRSGLFLFVIREGDQDFQDVYDRLFDIVKRGKKVFIVLNHEVSEPQTLSLAVDRISQILLSKAGRHEVPDSAIEKIGIFPLNVKTAYKARQKKSDKLLDHSGYSAFLNAFILWADLYNNEEGHLERLQQQVEERWFSPVLHSLTMQMEKEDNSLLTSLQKNRETLQYEKGILLNSAPQYIMQKIDCIRGEVSAILQSGEDESQIRSSLQSAFIPVGQQVEQWLNNELGSVQKRVISTTHVAGNANVPAPIADGKASVPELSVSDLPKAALGMADADLIKEGLLLGRQLKIPFLKGRWESTLGGWAGRAAPVLQVGLALWEMYAAHQKQEQANARSRKRAVQIQQTVEQICSQAVSALSEAAREVVSQTFSERIADVQKAIDAIQQGADERAQEYDTLKGLQDKIAGC